MTNWWYSHYNDSNGYNNDNYDGNHDIDNDNND